MKYIIPIVLSVLVSGCTTLLASEVNRHREKKVPCDSTRCSDLIDTAIFDVALGVKIARELIAQQSRETPIPAPVNTGNVNCEITEEKVSSVSFGCECRPQDNRDSAR